MKFIGYNIIFLVFASLGAMANMGSTSTGDFTRERINCDAYCPEFDDNAKEISRSNACLETSFAVSDKEEEYVDDIPFDTGKVVENIDSGEAGTLINKEPEEEITIFKLFIKWVSLMFQV
jgi:hypothetical protein